jgi:hypothetical protein
MAYAEKRGKGPRPWRVKYKVPGGEASQSGFETKQAALGWGRDQEAKVRAGTWTDPGAGEITVSDWIGRWTAMHDVGPSTTANREYRIRRFIRLSWGKRPLNSLTGEEIAGWERTLPAAEGVSRSTAKDARSLLHTILGDAAAARPPLIPFNPAVRPRNRGRRTGRGLDRSPQRAWATPLEVLLVAERAALLAGRDDEFTLLVTTGYTGMRWGETTGLERDLLRPSLINVEWQLREVSGRFCRLPPKDDSYRSTHVEPLTPVDLPPFLTRLLAAQAAKHAPQRCACAAGHGGSGRYLFLGPDGGHHRNSNYARRIFRPACDGRHPPANGSPGKLVIADAAAWPGTPVASWPPAVPGKRFAPPSGRGTQRLTSTGDTGRCPSCGHAVRLRHIPSGGAGLQLIAGRPGNAAAAQARRRSCRPCLCGHAGDRVRFAGRKRSELRRRREQRERGGREGRRLDAPAERNRHGPGGQLREDDLHPEAAGGGKRRYQVHRLLPELLVPGHLELGKSGFQRAARQAQHDPPLRRRKDPARLQRQAALHVPPGHGGRAGPRQQLHRQFQRYLLHLGSRHRER